MFDDDENYPRSYEEWKADGPMTKVEWALLIIVLATIGFVVWERVA